VKAPQQRYLALGDSYTIGTGASDISCSWPSIVALRLGRATGRDTRLTNPAQNGFTTLDLIRRELRYLEESRPDFVTVLIGVNDLVQGRYVEQYRSSLATIYDRIAALKLAQGCAVAISIPTWSYVPEAMRFGGANLVRELTSEFNAVAQKEAEARGFSWVDIGEVSASAIGTPGWIASDDLHPGDVQYAAWAEVIWESVRHSWTAAAGP
jgi:lysophospholipase L1-like esterase